MIDIGFNLLNAVKVTSGCENVAAKHSDIKMPYTGKPSYRKPYETIFLGSTGSQITGCLVPQSASHLFGVLMPRRRFCRRSSKKNELCRILFRGLSEPMSLQRRRSNECSRWLFHVRLPQRIFIGLEQTLEGFDARPRRGCVPGLMHNCFLDGNSNAGPQAL